MPDSVTNQKLPLLGMTLDDLRELCELQKLPRFAAGQIAKWLYDKRVTSIQEMTNLSKAARESLEKNYVVGREAPKLRLLSSDGTAKYLFTGAGSRDVEAVMIPDRDRATLCVSSQAGCRMGCKFCMTGMQGFHGNLSAAQIINQVLSVDEAESLTNIVFMGMGEPTDNLGPVMKAIEILTAPWGMAWSPKRITVSSIGKLPGLKTLLDRTKVHIAISLHSPYGANRAKMMPVEHAFPIESVVKLLRNYDFAHQRRLSMEYIMWRGLNDDDRHADAIARMLKGLDCRVNLIRFHAIPGVDLQPSATQRMEAFRDRLNSLGITATIRASRGEDIMAACGQLAGSKRQG